MSRQNKPQKSHKTVLHTILIQWTKAYMLTYEAISWYKVGQTKMFCRNIYSENDQFEKNTVCLLKCFFLTEAKECSLFEAFEFCATSGFSVVILETIQAEPLATWITSHQTELCLFPFKHLLHLPLLIFTGQCLVWMFPSWRACCRDERLLISIFSIWKWNWSCVKFGWLSAICVKICAFTMLTSKQNHNSYCHHLFALWDVS